METRDTSDAAPDGQPQLVTRILGVKPGEFAAAAWSFTYFFCILGAYYILRPVREAMAVQSGPDTIPYLFVGTFVTMLVATPIFGWVASRFPRKTFLPWVYYFFILNILIFWGTFSHAVDRDLDYVWLSRVFFVWISVFNLYVVAVFWSFMADLYTREQGRRLFGMISAGGSIGAIIGSSGTSSLVISIGFENLFPIAAALLLFAVFCISRLRRWVEHQHRHDESANIASTKPLGGSSWAGVTHVFQSKYFIVITISAAIASLLGTALYMFAAQLVEDAITSPDERTRFFSDINLWTNLFAAAMQLLVVKHVVARFGIGITLALLPVVSIAGFVLLAIEPTLAVVAVLTVIRRGLGFGLSKPTSDMLYSVVTPEEKYKAKNFIDTVLYRTGDVIGTWSVRGLVAAVGYAGASIVMLPFAVIWMFASIWLGREYRRRDEAAKAHA